MMKTKKILAFAAMLACFSSLCLADTTIYRGLDAKKNGQAVTSPSQFRIDEREDGRLELSTFVWEHKNDKPCQLGFSVDAHGNVADLPGYTAQITEPPPGHWSILVPEGKSKEDAKADFSTYATSPAGQARMLPASCRVPAESTTSSKQQVHQHAVATLERQLQSHIRIIGGLDAQNGEIPWQAGLIGSAKEPAAGLFCGGTIIHPRWILTAAHCVVRGTRPGDIKVFTGDVNLNQGCSNNRCNAVEKIILHQRYNQRTQENDIALLLLTNPIRSGGAPISWVQPEEASNAIEAGTPARVSGWGYTKENGKITPRLQVVNVPIVSAAECDRSYPGKITANMLCAGSQAGGRDACQGDSGGPLVVTVNTSTALAGAVSWGKGCGRPSQYGVYANVSKYTEWIRSQMRLYN